MGATPNVFDQVTANGPIQQTPPSQPSAPSGPATGTVFDQVTANGPIANASASSQSNDPSQTGELTNDVGQKVIVPKAGESFADTVKRAIQYHNSLTPEQQQAALNAESSTIPTKTAQTLGAAATIGAAGPAALAMPGELPGAAENVLQISEKALEHIGENYPQLAKLAGKLGYGAGAVGAYKLLNKLGIH